METQPLNTQKLQKDTGWLGAARHLLTTRHSPPFDEDSLWGLGQEIFHFLAVHDAALVLIELLPHLPGLGAVFRAGGVSDSRSSEVQWIPRGKRGTSFFWGGVGGG